MTTLQQLPSDVLDIIYRKKHELETADIVSSIKLRHDNLIDRCKKLIDNMRKYGKYVLLIPKMNLNFNDTCTYTTSSIVIILIIY